MRRYPGAVSGGADYESVNSSLLAAIASHGDEAKFIPDLMKSVDALGGTIVVPGGEAAAVAPTTSYAVDFADFSFNFPATVATGNNLWKISNVGSQVHLATIYKLTPGKTMDDLKAFLGRPGDAGGPPPLDTTDILDVEAVSPGQTVYIPLDLSDGDWVAVCFIQDLTPPHLPHFMEWMIQGSPSADRLPDAQTVRLGNGRRHVLRPLLLSLRTVPEPKARHQAPPLGGVVRYAY